MDILSAEPGLQIYSGNFLDGTIVGKGGHIYRQGEAVCLEPRLFPDTPNRRAFGSARLTPGETCENRMIFRFSVARLGAGPDGPALAAHIRIRNPAVK